MPTKRKRDNLERKLIEASINNNLGTIAFLIANGVDANARDHKGMTALHHQTEQNNVEGVRFLVGEDRQATGRYGIMYKTAALDKNISNEFALNVSCVNLADDNGNRPIHIAALNDNKEIIGILAAHGADINARNDTEKTALHYAAWYGCMHAVAEIIRLGADIDAKDRDGMAPIHYAANNNQIDAARYLRKHRADILSANNTGNTPFELALWQGYNRMAKILRQ